MDRIVAENVSVEFPIYDTTGRSLRHALGLGRLAGAIKNTANVGGAIGEHRGHLVVRALDDVTFSFQDGDRIGLIGHNGCGKTTLLRVLAGIYEPTDGRMAVLGRIMPLFNLTEGMTPDATGRELIYVRGILLDLTPEQIGEITPEIIEFCELGHYINMPLRTYSTGMLVRLAFAITTAVSAEILLFDELIGAGDAHFVDRAQKRLREFVERSSLMVVATHSRDILYKWCTRAILLEHGKLIEFGPVDRVLATYDRIRANQ
ncbi:MAG: ABC transporter ATP-binding protein [Candidatus Binatia bacterium]